MQSVETNNTLNLKNFSKFLDSLSVLKNRHTLGISVSSGVDSMCLLHLANKWAKKNKKNLFVISYNHNIRKETNDEVEYVRKISKKLGWQHVTLKWIKPAKKNILEQARIARYQNFVKKKKLMHYY